MTNHTISTLTDPQEKVMALLILPSACVSILGSAAIIVMASKSIIKQRKHNRTTTPYTRLLLGMSCCDVIFSITLILSGFLMPKEASQRVWATGNDASCSFLGFLLQFSYSTLLYNMMLSFYFVLTARFGVKNDVFSRRIEPMMHITCLGFPLATAIAGVAMGIYNEMELGQGCWINDYPENCGTDIGRSGEPCDSPMLAWIFGGSVTFLTLICLIVNNTIILIFVVRQTQPLKQRKQQKKSITAKSSSCITSQRTADDEETNCGLSINVSRELASIDSSLRNPSISNPIHDTSDPTEPTENEDLDSSSFSIPADRKVPDYERSYDDDEPKSVQHELSNFIDRHQRQQLKRLKLVASQAFLYVGAFITCTIWTIILRIWESQTYNASKEDDIYFLLILQSIFLPLQGVFNMLIYTRPKYIKLRKDFPNESRIWAVRRAIIGDNAMPTIHQRCAQNDKEQNKEKELAEPLEVLAKRPLPFYPRRKLNSTEKKNLQRNGVRWPGAVIHEHTLSSITASHGDFTDEGSKLNGDKWKDKEVALVGDSNQHQLQRLKSSLIEGSSLEAISELTASCVGTALVDDDGDDRIISSVDIAGVVESVDCDLKSIISSESLSTSKKNVRFEGVDDECDQEQSAGRWSSSTFHLSSPQPFSHTKAVSHVHFDRMDVAGSSRRMDTPIHAPKRRPNRMEAGSSRNIDSPIKAPKRRLSPPIE